MVGLVKETAKKTFTNLDENRQKEIVDAALLEFLIHDYQNASLSQIIKNIGIAKGSFYRYFNSKKDLYIYLLYYTTKFRLSDISILTTEKNLSLEDVIIENFKMKIEFDKKYPLYSGFSYRVLRETSKEVGHIKKELWKSVLNIIRSILLNYVNHQPNVKIDIQVASFSILQTQLAIFEYLEIIHNVNFIDNIKKGLPIFSINEELLMQIVNEFTTIVVHGIINKDEK
jgi:AcrR family transcriptional regulator